MGLICILPEKTRVSASNLPFEESVRNEVWPAIIRIGYPLRLFLAPVLQVLKGSSFVSYKEKYEECSFINCLGDRRAP